MARPEAARLPILRWTAARVTDLAEPDRWEGIAWPITTRRANQASRSWT